MRFETRDRKDSKECTSVAETEDEIVEKIKLLREKTEEVKMDETQAKKLVKEQLSQEETLRAEESESEGNHMR